jgi:hypothetical protein
VRLRVVIRWKQLEQYKFQLERLSPQSLEGVYQTAQKNAGLTLATEAISELNQFLLRLDREEPKDREREP